jgi:hypothetical protein
MVNVMVSLIERRSIANGSYKGEQSICIYKFKKRFQEIVNGKDLREANTEPLYIDPAELETTPSIAVEAPTTVEETLGGRKQIRRRRSNRTRRRSSRKTLKKRRKVKRKTKKYAK